MDSPASFAAVNLKKHNKYNIHRRSGCGDVDIPGVYHSISNGVRAYSKWTPLFCNCLSKTYHCCFRCCIVGLTNITMEACGR
jgi:hypothetical protein